MCKMIGFILFWVAVGMVIELFITEMAISVFVIIVLILLGYNLFLCNK